MDRLRSLFGKGEPESPVRRFRATEPYQYELESYQADRSEFAGPEEFLTKVTPGATQDRQEWLALTADEWSKLTSRREGLAGELSSFREFQKAWLITHPNGRHDNFLDYLAEDSHTCLLELEESYVLVKLTLLSLH